MNIGKVSASKVAPLAMRVLSSRGSHQRYRHHHCSAILSVQLNRSSSSHSHICGGFHQLSRSLPSAIHHYSSKSLSLIQALNDEIEIGKGTQGDDEILDDFPFKIEEDYPKKTTIKLSREYQGETVVVEVYLQQQQQPPPNPLVDKTTTATAEEEKKDINDKLPTFEKVPLRVTITRHPKIFSTGDNMVFNCTAYLPDKRISIDSFSLNLPNEYDSKPHLHYCNIGAMSENLQNAFLKYLEKRGIKPNMTNVLKEYMINKDNTEYILWLKRVKKFFQS